MLLDLNGYGIEDIRNAAACDALASINIPLSSWLVLARCMYIGLLPKHYVVYHGDRSSQRSLINAIQCLLVNSQQVTDDYYAAFVGFDS